MNNTNIFINQVENAQFLSVTNLILILGNILYNNTKFPALESKVETITIVNALCEFLKENSQEEEKILDLGHKLLEETDFYGAKRNESLHFKLVNAMLNNIIAKSVFSKFGNTFGYLSTIVNSTDNLMLSSVKEKITSNLYNLKFLNDNGTISTLSNVTIARITQEIIFPLFPEPKNNMEIINVKYIYAQAGWLLLRNSQGNNRSTSFSKLIALAMNVEQGVFNGETDASALQIFQLPALLYYTHQKRNGIQQKNLKSIMMSTHFWHRVYSRLFTDLNATMEKISILHKRSPSYRFQMAFADFKTRTVLADEVLRENCPNISHYENELTDYKYNPESYYCNKQLQPDINEIFFNQNRIIAKKYYNYEKHLISQVFDEDLKKFIDLKNVTIKPIAVFWKNNCFRCRILTSRPTLSEGIDLFQIFEAGVAKTIYALIRSKNGVKLLPARDLFSFLEEIGLNDRAKLHVPFAAEDMKSSSSTDDFDTFVTFVAKSREKKFLAYLKNIGYDATTLEKVSDFFKHLIPFYSCAESIRDVDTTKQTAAMACIVDSIVVIPVFGLLTSTSVKFTTVTMRSALLRLSEHMGELTLKEIFKSVMKIGLHALAEDVINAASQVINKQLIQNFGVAIFRSLDPGIEFFYMATENGARALMKGWKLLKRYFSVKSMEHLKSVSIIKIGTYKGYDVHVQSISGQDGFGLKTIDYQGRQVYLRRIRGYANEMPVAVINNDRRHKKYRIIDLESGKLSGTEWEESDGILVTAVKPLRVHLKTIQIEGLSGRRQGYVRSRTYEYIEEERNLALALVKQTEVLNFMEEALKCHVFGHYERTPKHFIKHWSSFKTFPHWSLLYRLIDRKLYEKLRFSAYLEDVILHHMVAVERVMNYYGHEYVRDVINVNPEMMFSFYNNHQLHDSITFMDQFAIANVAASGFSRLHFDDLEALSMKRALYTTALRQYDISLDQFKFMDDLLYTVELRPANGLFPLKDGKVIDINQFTMLARKKSDVLSHFTFGTEMHLVRVLHQIKLDSHCLTVYFQKYLPFNTDNVVLLPGVKLFLHSWMNMQYKGQNVVVITWKNVRVDNAKWLADTANKIKSIMNHEESILQVQKDVILNFDVALLNK